MCRATAFRSLMALALMALVKSSVLAAEQQPIRNASGETPAHEAARSGDVARLEALLDAPARLNDVDDEGQTPLFLAAREGELEAVALLLERGADPNAKNDHQLTPLCAALFQRAGAVAQRLVSDGADVNTPCVAGGKLSAPLALVWLTSEQSERAALVRSLLAAGADPNVGGFSGSRPHPPLLSALQQADLDVARQLVNAGANKDRVLLIAVVSRRPVFNKKPHTGIRFLLEAGANANAPGRYGDTPVLRSLAAFRASVSLLELLFEHGAEPDAADAAGIRAGHYASFYEESGGEVLSKLLHAAGATPGPSAPLHVRSAVRFQDFEKLDQLLAESPSLGNDPRLLDLAIAPKKAFDARVLERLVAHMREHHPKALARSENRTIPIRLLHPRRNASEADETERLRHLQLVLDAGANPAATSFTSRGGPASLHFSAAVAGETIRILVKGGARIGERCEYGHQMQHCPLPGALPIHTWAFESGILLARVPGFGDPIRRALGALIAAGADVSARAATAGHTPLHLAAHPDVVKLLAAAGADVNARLTASTGDTPLHAAVRRTIKHSSAPSVTDALLHAGADPTIRNAQGETPLELALRKAPGEAEVQRWRALLEPFM
ncbi:MAG: ankyrin repeat domain-containing protein [Pseudomonadota bacterium]